MNYTERRNPALLIAAFLLFQNFAFSIIQTNVSSLYIMISEDFKTGLDELSLSVSLFFLGYLLFTLPVSAALGRLGLQKRVAIGSVVTCISTILGSLGGVQLFNFLRFFAGAGYGIFFPVAVTKLSGLAQKKGSLIGLFNSSYTLGGAIGLGIWGYLGLKLGWRISYMLSGALLIFLLPFILSEKEDSSEMDDMKILNILNKRITVALFVNALTAAAAIIAFDSIIVYYLEQVLSLGITFAGFIGTISFLMTFLFSSFSGLLIDRGIQRWFLFLISAVLISGGMIVMIFQSVVLAIVSSVDIGIGAGIGATVLYVEATNVSETQDIISLSTAIIDTGISIGTVIGPIFFLYLATSEGYSAAWTFVGILPLLSLPLLAYTHKGNRPR